MPVLLRCLMSSKPCLRCCNVVLLSGFSKNRRKKDGLEIYCKPCVSAASAAHYAANRERRAAQQKAWFAANPGKAARYSQAWRAANPGAQAASERSWYESNREKALRNDRAQRNARIEAARAVDRARYWADLDRAAAKNRAWREANPARIAALAAERRAAKAQRTPKWLNESDWEAIASVYERARRLTVETGVEHHVDHIVPLRGARVSGLHVAWNLQCLPATENLKKSNRCPE